MNNLANYFMLLLQLVDSTVVRFFLISSRLYCRFDYRWKLRYEAIDLQGSTTLLHTFITGSVKDHSVSYPQPVLWSLVFTKKVSADPFQSIPLLDEHDITIEYLENLENLMFQKYFQLASMIDPIIDNCYHIQIENWKFFKNSLNQVSTDESLGKKWRLK